MTCPKCAHPTTSVTRTSPSGFGGVRRVRRCENPDCRATLVTMENVIQELVKLPPQKVSNPA